MILQFYLLAIDNCAYYQSPRQVSPSHSRYRARGEDGDTLGPGILCCDPSQSERVTDFCV